VDGFPAQQLARLDHVKLEQGADVDAGIGSGYGYRLLVPTRRILDHSGHHPQDILRNASGARWRLFDPYVDWQIKVTLGNAVPVGGADGRMPAWQIDFDPDSIECPTWDNVFHVREWIKRDVLYASFWQWLRDFSAWFKKRMGIAAPGDAEILDARHT